MTLREQLSAPTACNSGRTSCTQWRPAVHSLSGWFFRCISVLDRHTRPVRFQFGCSIIQCSPHPYLSTPGMPADWEAGHEGNIPYNTRVDRCKFSVIFIGVRRGQCIRCGRNGGTGRSYIFCYGPIPVVYLTYFCTIVFFQYRTIYCVFNNTSPGRAPETLTVQLRFCTGLSVYI